MASKLAAAVIEAARVFIVTPAFARIAALVATVPPNAGSELLGDAVDQELAGLGLAEAERGDLAVGDGVADALGDEEEQRGAGTGADAEALAHGDLPLAPR